MYFEEKLAVRVADDGDTVRILSPAVGIWSAIPASGTLVGRGSKLGLLTQLNRRVTLELPDTISGQIELPDPRRARKLAYGELMFRLTRIAQGHGTSPPSGDTGAADEESETGLLALRAPTDGVFYLRPAPDAEPFVKIGQKIRRGHSVGLIEVMKTFNQVVYDGPALPEEGIVAEIRVQDGDEVSAGQPLLVVR